MPWMMFIAPLAILFAPILIPLNLVLANFFPSIFVDAPPEIALVIALWSDPLSVPGMLWDYILQLFR